jgi:hypothetical protein
MGCGFLVQVFGMATCGDQKLALEIGQAHFGGLPTPHVDGHWLQNLRVNTKPAG